MHFRWINKKYAELRGYFWLPCPVCGQNFGGHEWKHRHSIPVLGDENMAVGICSDCGEGYDFRDALYDEKNRILVQKGSIAHQQFNYDNSNIYP